VTDARLALLTSVYLLYWYKRTNTDAARRVTDARLVLLTSVCLLYWYKRTNTDAARRVTDARLVLLTSKDPAVIAQLGEKSMYSVCLHYWYKRTFYLLYWYKRTNTDAAQSLVGEKGII
jgi:hypothetical protein